ncbi:MAG: hypothetical protein H6658_05940 [Ardenticatenaceae bacterium]|nr:hypothetical protein [Ardenticatenaceae bacterium]
MNQAQLLEDISQHFDEAGLRQLCQELNVTYSYLAGLTLRERAEAMIHYLERRQRLPRLALAVVAKRPFLANRYDEEPAPHSPELADNLGWLEEMALGGGTAVEELPTLKWSDKPEETAYVGPTEQDIAALLDTAATLDRPESSVPTYVTTSPYSSNRPVANKQLFFGRTTEREQIRNRLLNMDSSAVVGPRHMGKSSLLFFLSHHEFWPEDHHFLLAYLDAQESVYQTCRGLLDGILQQWEVYLNGRVQATHHPYPPVGDLLAPTAVDPADFARRVQALHAAGYRPVLCLDDVKVLLERPSEFPNDLFDTWHTLAQNRQMAFVTASQRPLADIFTQANRTSRFPALFRQINLGLLSQDAAYKLLNEPMARQNIVVPNAAFEQLLALCGPHPFYLQMAASYLFQDLLIGHYQPEPLAERFRRQAEPHWRGLWQSLPSLAQTLLSLPIKPDAPARIAREYRLLVQLGVLVEEGDRYRHFSQGFADWVKTEAESQNLIGKLRDHLKTRQQ